MQLNNNTIFMFKKRCIFVSVICMLLTSCNTLEQKSTTAEISYSEGSSLSIPGYDGYDINHRHPVVFNYKKNGGIHTAIYLVRQTDPFWIDKYENIDNKTVKVDSIAVPEEVFMGIHQNINDFAVIGLDSFMIQPSYTASNAKNIFYEFSKNHIKLYELPNIHKNKTFIIANMNMNPINFEKNIGVGRLMYLEGNGDANAFVDTVCKYNALVKFNLNDSSVEFFDEYDDVLCERKIGNIFIQLKRRLINQQSIITLSPFKQEFHIFDGDKMKVKKFNFEEFDEHHFNMNDSQKEMWVNDYFVSLMYNPFTHKYYVLMFEGGNYIEPDDFIKKPKQKRRYTLLIFNESLDLESKLNFNDNISEIYTGRLFPSPKGVFLRKQLGRNYEIQEFIIQ